MLLLDVNVVLAAHRGDHPHHASVRPWFDALVGDGDDFAVPDAVGASFLRWQRTAGSSRSQTPLADAFAFIEATCAQPGHVRLGPGRRHLVLLRRLCEEADATGDLVPDAVLGTIAVEHGCGIATLDRDFARFASVRHLRPEATT